MDDIGLSVVIAAHNAGGVIDDCLRALMRQSSTTRLEVIVADSSSDSTPAIVRERFPWVRLLHFDEPLTIPILRSRGLGVARGAIIAILDPFSVTMTDWASSVLSAHARHAHSVIGGSVDLHREESASHATWSVYLNEYALFMSPTRRGRTWTLPGTNVSYKRAALFDGPTPRYPVFRKVEVNETLRNAGGSGWMEPDIRVQMNKPLSFAGFLRTRYHHGRCFAALRIRGGPATKRFLRAGSTALVPVLLLWRLTIGFWPKGRLRWRFVTTMPAQLALFAVWAWGEACGYLRGTGGSCDHIYS